MFMAAEPEQYIAAVVLLVPVTLVQCMFTALGIDAAVGTCSKRMRLKAWAAGRQAGNRQLLSSRWQLATCPSTASLATKCSGTGQG